MNQKIYIMRQRLNQQTVDRNILGLKYPFHEVLVNDKPLLSRIVNGKRDTKKENREFSWGYHGVYPTNLAVSILCDFFDIDDYSKLFSEDGYCFATNQFYDKFIVPNKEASWKITEEELTKYMIGISEEIDRMNNEK